ncbi:Phage terminase-like protein, large subunit (plasmid) [Piscirickettsia salmonis]|uniref:Phage Terminase family protein n=1 Tax=Piscirickettsia salmonis TaxID=1238 RepID=A0AAC8VLE3_PISSA|nr:phage Terminase family protein [Piscirickettsia salmonis]QGO00267.1 Phage terminase-like protein, large subunit [Piscirickettsia salmonis]QGO03884.1 Phage terminase-like protein, large subunit [Piscirickettsia salmonis]QGO14532.1 Phage terminase-like protein, large subunit [Piscirickettsia salmonis]QGO21612.1 Phage terminase-like protein, large subunit [Piscirickettsia salmonis]
MECADSRHVTLCDADSRGFIVVAFCSAILHHWMCKIPTEVATLTYIKDDIYQLNKEFDVKEITYDPWNATQLANDLLEEGANMVEFRQDFKSMTPALKELERLVISTKLHHNNNPVLNWMASNLVVVEDDAGNMKPSKRKSTEKIDGMVAIAMAVGRLIAGEDHNSIYNERELLIL